MDAFTWFPILAKRHDEGAPRIALLRSYTNGRPPLPEMGKNTKSTWSSFQRKATMDLGGLICSAASDRMRFAGLVIGEERAAAETLARRILRDNRFESVLAEALRSALIDGESYMLTAVDADGKAIVTAETAQHVTVSVDPLRPWSPRAAIKVWRDLDAGLDFAFCWDGTYRVKFQRPIRNKKSEIVTRVSGGSWEPVDVVEVGRVPLVVIRPNADGLGAFEPHMPAIDRAHLGVLNRLVTMAMQAFQQRYLTGGLPKTDESGNPIDWKGFFENAPGAIWDLPAGLDIKSLPQSSFQDMLNASKDDLRDVAAVSRTPLASLNPEGANQSAEGAIYAREGLIYRVLGYLDRVTPAIELTIVRLLRIESPEILDENDTVTVLWTPPQLSSDSERGNAMAMAMANGMSFRDRMITIGGYSADTVDRMEENIRIENLERGAYFQPEPAPVLPITPPAPQLAIAA